MTVCSPQEPLMSFEVYIPFHPKDWDSLPACLRGIRENVTGAGEIFVTGRSSERAAVETMGVRFLDEDAIVPGLPFASQSGQRWGWYFQQILKLGIADICGTRYYLVVDSDTVFHKPTPIFNAAGKPFYGRSEDLYPPAAETIRSMLGIPVDYTMSFIVHHMVFDRQVVEEIRNRLPGGPPWYACILDCRKNGTYFSEYETYGYYLKAFYPSEMEIRTLKWSDIASAPKSSLLPRLAKYYDYAAFHAYLREARNGPLHTAKVRFKIERRLIKYRLRDIFGGR